MRDKTIQEIRFQILACLINANGQKQAGYQVGMYQLIHEAEEAMEFIYGKKDEPVKPAEPSREAVLEKAYLLGISTAELAAYNQEKLVEKATTDQYGQIKDLSRANIAQLASQLGLNPADFLADPMSKSGYRPVDAVSTKSVPDT